MLERERELAELAAAFDAAKEREGSLVVIAGAAGAGKSAMLAECAERARERGCGLRRARGSELEQELAFGVIQQLFEPALRSASAGERDRLLAGAAAPTARLFADAPLDRGAGGDGGFATLHGLYWLVAAIAADRPLLLTVDDAHWIDAPSLRALNYLAGRIAELPVVLLVALRPHEPVPAADLVAALESGPAVKRLELTALSPGAVAVIVRSDFPAAGDDVCAACLEASGGNPFLLRELLRSVTHENGASVVAARIRDAAVASVGDRVMRRIAALGPHAPRLAAAMSVLGSGGRIRDAAVLAGGSEEQAGDAARAMRRVEILATEDPFEWIHPLVRRSIYDNLSVVDRGALHGHAAEALAAAGAPPGVVAAQLSQLRPDGSADVVAALLRAADDALARDAPEVAVNLLRRALEEGASDPPRTALLLRLGRVEVTRRNPDAAAVLREVLELSRDPRERTLAAMALAESLTHDGRWDESATTVSRAIEELGGADAELAGELEVVHAIICAFDPALAPGLWRNRDRLLLLARADSWPARALSAMLAVTSALRGEQLEQVLPLCDHALGDGALIAERGAGAWAASHVLGALASIDANDRALAFAAELDIAAREQGSVANAINAEGYSGWIALRRGDLAAGEEILRPILDTALAGDMLLLVVTVLWWLGDVSLERSSSADLADKVEAIELPAAIAGAGGGAWLFTVRGKLRLARGDRVEAEQDLRRAGDIFRRLGFGPVHEPWRSAIALALPSDQAEEARTLVDDELTLARGTGLARPIGIVLRASGLIAQGDGQIVALRESVAVLADSPARCEHARSLVELGAALRRSGRRADAREPLEAGMELAHHCGADRLVTRAREELLAAGARPRRILRSGFAALTASERRIVRLAADGRSNPEIAQGLYVSIKTVETHLSNAYRKLQLSGPGARRRLHEQVTDGAAT